MENIDFAEDILIRLRNLGAAVANRRFRHRLLFVWLFYSSSPSTPSRSTVPLSIAWRQREQDRDRGHHPHLAARPGNGIGGPEWVETKNSSNAQAVGLHYGQGFLISRPVRAQVVEELLAGGQVQASFTPCRSSKPEAPPSIPRPEASSQFGSLKMGEVQAGCSFTARQAPRGPALPVHPPGNALPVVCPGAGRGLQEAAPRCRPGK